MAMDMAGRRWQPPRAWHWLPRAGSARRAGSLGPEDGGQSCS